MEESKKIKSVKLIYAIEVNSLEGDGTENDPFRIETSHWSLEGKNLQNDSSKESAAINDAPIRNYGSSDNPMTHEEWIEHKKAHKPVRCPD